MDYYSIKRRFNTVELPEMGIIDDHTEDYSSIYSHGYSQAIRDVMHLFMSGNDVSLQVLEGSNLNIDMIKSDKR